MARGKPRPIVWAALIGALLPDLSLYLLAGVSLFVLSIPPETVFNELYFSDGWQTIFAIDNSALLWGALCLLALWRRSDWLIALSCAALLHVILDFPLHHDDGRPHFWPISNWVFESPVSYWDRSKGASLVAPLEAGLAVAAAIILWRQKLKPVLSFLILALVIAELWIARQWLFVFQVA